LIERKTMVECLVVNIMQIVWMNGDGWNGQSISIVDYFT
jgi:hypothetical protein